MIVVIFLFKETHHYQVLANNLKYHRRWLCRENQNLILETIEADHWYFVSGSYVINDDNTTTFTNYIADLSAGENILKRIGPFTNSGGPYPTGGSPVGIGGRWDAGESFPGQIDEINIYNSDKEQFFSATP